MLMKESAVAVPAAAAVPAVPSSPLLNNSSNSSSSNNNNNSTHSSTSSSSTNAAETEWYMSPLEIVAGGIAGFGEHTAMFPFDTIKTRMQQHIATSGERENVRKTVMHVVRQEKFRNLYRGCGPIVLSAIPAHAAYFGLYEAAKRWLGGDSSTSQYVIAAAFATTGHDAVSTPFDVVKQRMQVDSQRKFKSSAMCAKTIIRNEGAGALFVSLPTTIAMNIPQIATHWVVYESCKKYLTEIRQEEEDETAIHFVASGLLAGACAAVVSAPMDVVRTQLQLGNPIHNPAVLARMVYDKGGIRGLFTGVVPRVFFMAPSAAICMTTYETSKKMLAPVLA